MMTRSSTFKVFLRSNLTSLLSTLTYYLRMINLNISLICFGGMYTYPVIIRQVNSMTFKIRIGTIGTTLSYGPHDCTPVINSCLPYIIVRPFSYVLISRNNGRIILMFFRSSQLVLFRRQFSMTIVFGLNSQVRGITSSRVGRRSIGKYRLFMYVSVFLRYIWLQNTPANMRCLCSSQFIITKLHFNCIGLYYNL